MKNTDLKKRIVDLSYKHRLSHLGSCLSSVDIIDEIYSIKKSHEKFVLSSGHAGLALYCVIEKYEKIDAEKIYLHHGVHPDRCEKCHLFCSTGSLGQGLPIALGMAIADKTQNVYCLISDGECAEGSIWESFNIIEKFKIDNLIIYINLNGFSAYQTIDIDHLEKSIEAHLPIMKKNIKFVRTSLAEFSFLKSDISAHYHIISDDEYMEWNLII
jgi:transketolase